MADRGIAVMSARLYVGPMLDDVGDLVIAIRHLPGYPERISMAL